MFVYEGCSCKFDSSYYLMYAPPCAHMGVVRVETKARTGEKPRLSLGVPNESGSTLNNIVR